MRYYEGPLLSDGRDGATARRAYDGLRHETCVLGDQGYEHPFNACVLFSDISGFTKLTNRLLRERGVEGAEILNGIICRFFEELISIITRCASRHHSSRTAGRRARARALSTARPFNVIPCACAAGTRAT